MDWDHDSGEWKEMDLSQYYVGHIANTARRRDVQKALLEDIDRERAETKRTFEEAALSRGVEIVDHLQAAMDRDKHHGAQSHTQAITSHSTMIVDEAVKNGRSTPRPDAHDQALSQGLEVGLYVVPYAEPIQPGRRSAQKARSGRKTAPSSAVRNSIRTSRSAARKQSVPNAGASGLKSSSERELKMVKLNVSPTLKEKIEAFGQRPRAGQTDIDQREQTNIDISQDCPKQIESAHLTRRSERIRKRTESIQSIEHNDICETSNSVTQGSRKNNSQTPAVNTHGLKRRATDTATDSQHNSVKRRRKSGSNVPSAHVILQERLVTLKGTIALDPPTTLEDVEEDQINSLPSAGDKINTAVISSETLKDGKASQIGAMISLQATQLTGRKRRRSEGNQGQIKLKETGPGVSLESADSDRPKKRLRTRSPPLQEQQRHDTPRPDASFASSSSLGKSKPRQRTKNSRQTKKMGTQPGSLPALKLRFPERIVKGVQRAEKLALKRLHKLNAGRSSVLD
ncbi:MAG: hypothetical protein Q9227_001125 [Pyrenula ochraceoflavens]